MLSLISRLSDNPSQAFISTKAQELQFTLEKTSKTQKAVLFIDYFIYFVKEKLRFIGVYISSV